MLMRHEGIRKLCAARDHLRDVSDDAPTIEAVAATVGISTFHFIRQFKALFGETPHQYRTAARLALARGLLARGDAVTDVCMAVGFSSLGSFSTLFARRVGEPPSAYRRRRYRGSPHDDAAAAAAPPGCFSLLARLPADRSFREASPDVS